MQRISQQLIEEFMSWFFNLAEQGKDLPKAFSGVKRDGTQFIVMLSDLPIEQGEHLDFMTTVLRAEDAIAYAYKMRVGALSEKTNMVEERVEFFSGEPGLYFFLEVVPRDGISWKSGFYETSKTCTDHPELFLQDLFLEPFEPVVRSEEYLALWKSVRDKVMWRQRSV